MSHWGAHSQIGKPLGKDNTILTITLAGYSSTGSALHRARKFVVQQASFIDPAMNIGVSEASLLQHTRDLEDGPMLAACLETGAGLAAAAEAGLLEVTEPMFTVERAGMALLSAHQSHRGVEEGQRALCAP